ncbi:MAG: metallophosphoesterase [Clostridia bacterium]|nr:metallophosphoesterase [Clostridia bacterium]
MKNSNTIRFNAAGKLRIMQVSDPQDMKYVRKAMVRMLDNAYDALRPDLVLFTGDNILGNHLLDARIGDAQVAGGKSATLEIMRDSIHNIVAPLEKRGIPFAMIYGNHDDRNDVSKREQADIYRSYKGCLPMNNSRNGLDDDTYNITVLPSEGDKPLFNIWMLDSAWYDKKEDVCYERIKPETVEWYKKTAAQLKEQNGGEPLPSLMFLHIPLPEIENLIEPCMPDECGAVKTHKMGWCRLRPDITRGVMSEYPSVLEDSAGLFDAVLECGDVKGIVSGHDHVNCFEGKYMGVDFIQTSCASFRCYGDETRGVRIFEFDERDPSEYITYFFNYADLCGRGALAKLRYAVDADGYLKDKTSFITDAASTAIGAAGAFFRMAKEKKNNL